MIKEQITSGKTLMEGSSGIMTLEKLSRYLYSQPCKMAGKGKAYVVKIEVEGKVMIYNLYLFLSGET